jgi:hypothetical protein
MMLLAEDGAPGRPGGPRGGRPVRRWLLAAAASPATNLQKRASRWHAESEIYL